MVRSPAGKFRGKTLRAPNGRRYNSIRGIPYAHPPVGDLRFFKPQPLPRIQGTFDETEYGPICVQPVGRPDRGQEDCFSLNVFTRLIHRILHKRNLKPVMVVVHGGGVILESSQDHGLPVAEGLCLLYRRDPVVRSRAGKFQGKTLRAPNRRWYNSYRGIPYAQPPVGDLRFAKPQPLSRIQGTFEASDFGPICVQPVGLTDRGQEDCLSLNVFTPLTDFYATSRRRLKPVLVFIHGGGLILGSSKDLSLPGDLVTRGDILVVTPNYRLGWLGFLRGDTDQLPGNQALLDVVLALEWVKDNIRSFGGDPDDVTLGGHSAGSNIATFLSVSPLTKGLFRKTILLSGGFIALPSPPRTTNDLLTIAANQFCSNSGDTVDVERATECLKNVAASSLSVDLTIQTLLPSSGDDVFPSAPSELYSNQSYLLDVGFFSRSYLLSTTKDDGISYVNSNLLRPDISTPEITENTFAPFLAVSPEIVQTLLEPYRNLSSGNDERALTAFFTDFFIQQNIDFLEVFTSAPADIEGEAFLMSFDYEPSYIRDMFVLHGLDLLYLFDLSPQGLLDLYYSTFTLEGSFTKQDRRVQRSFIGLITDFVKTGNPGRTISRRTKEVWDPFDPDLKNFLSFSTCPAVEQDLRGRTLAG